MNEHPILFSTPMVTAILDARKIQTRRVVDKLYPISNPNGNWVYVGEENGGYVFKDSISSTIPLKCHYGRVGDRLWVRETWAELGYWSEGTEPHMLKDKKGEEHAIVYYQESAGDFEWTDSDGSPEYAKDGRERSHWKPSVSMPRWASRITLEITDIRVQRIQDITEEDAIAEGAQAGYILASPTIFHKGLPGYTETPKDYRMGYMRLWDSINLKRGYGWDNNPWVWVISFKVLEVNK